MTHPTPPEDLLQPLERLVIGAVGVTATAVGEAAHDLTLLQWRVIVVLAAADDGMAVSELARRLGSRVPAMSRLLARLRSRGLVEARKDQPDARITTVLLADPGRELWRRVVDRRRADLAAAMTAAGMGMEEARVISRLATALEAFA